MKTVHSSERPTIVDPSANETTVPAPGPVVTDAGDEEYEVNEVLASRKFRNSFQYLVDWVGYPSSERSWVRWQDVANAPDLVRAFHARYPDAVGPREFRP